MRKYTLLLALMPSLSSANITNSEIYAYAHEGLAELCVASRYIVGDELSEMRSIYIAKKNHRTSLYPSDPKFAFFASKRLWNIGVGDHPSYSECIEILK
ncbi:hypothetical protein [Vibrio sp. SCSIO 43136]|uniref:hypothetical protein n=1 Tax=Vibrio sp. SCSIO 43136 TaxID=2819101 RepID=UPI002075CFEE|nr:hypothetical protein [Vibrio sp. SCSIO 43136]USD66381.1 hypothetical protein J4N39_06105 [Vibrio sp. SCSIO 43136]